MAVGHVARPLRLGHSTAAVILPALSRSKPAVSPGQGHQWCKTGADWDAVGRSSQEQCTWHLGVSQRKGRAYISAQEITHQHSNHPQGSQD